jgi:hypothetical protein
MAIKQIRSRLSRSTGLALTAVQDRMSNMGSLPGNCSGGSKEFHKGCMMYYSGPIEVSIAFGAVICDIQSDG